MQALLALAGKDLMLLRRNRGHLFFTFVWPLVAALFFGTVFGGDGDDNGKITVRVVDEDQTPASAQLIAAVGRMEGVEATPATREAGLDAVRHSKAAAVVIAPKGYGDAAGRLFYGAPPEIELWVDPSRKAEAAMLSGQLMGAAMERMQTLFQGGDAAAKQVDRAIADAAGLPGGGDPTLVKFLGEVKTFVGDRAPAPAEAGAEAASGKSGGWEPVSVLRHEVQDETRGPRSGFEVAFPQGVLWGMLGCALGFALSLVTERSRGTLARLRTSPLTRTHVLAGKALACFVALLAVQALLFTIGAIAFRVVPSSIPMLIAGCVSLAAAFVGIMMVVSVLARSEQSAGGLAWAVFLPLSMVGGGMVPLFAMPAWMQALGNFSPVKWGILALEGAIWRGFTWADMALPCGILLAVGGLCFGVGARLFARTDA
jgi:ABC-2 type transport system permease protein